MYRPVIPLAWFERRSVAGLAAILLAFLALKAGVWVIPNLTIFTAIAQDPFVNPLPKPNEHYLFWNWLGHLLSWLAGADSDRGSALVYFACHLLFFAVMVRLLCEGRNPRERTRALLLLPLFAFSYTSLYWLGLDGLTLLLMALTITVRGNLPLSAALGVLLGMQHFEQAFFAYGAVVFACIVARDAGQRTHLRWAACVLGGVVAGKLALMALFWYCSIEVNSGRLHWYRQYSLDILRTFLQRWPTILWGTLGCAWLLLVPLRHRPGFRPFLACALGLFVLMPIVADHTRVYTIAIFPAAMIFVLLDKELIAGLSDEFMDLAVFLAVLAPVQWVWGGKIPGSVFPYDLLLLSRKLTGWPPVPDNLYMWPF